MLKSLPLQQLMRFAHCEPGPARYLFTESVLKCLIAMFNCRCGASARDAGGTAGLARSMDPSGSDV
jgi:hypothetical protein